MLRLTETFWNKAGSIEARKAALSSLRNISQKRDKLYKKTGKKDLMKMHKLIVRRNQMKKNLGEDDATLLHNIIKGDNRNTRLKNANKLRFRGQLRSRLKQEASIRPKTLIQKGGMKLWKKAIPINDRSASSTIRSRKYIDRFNKSNNPDERKLRSTHFDRASKHYKLNRKLALKGNAMELTGQHLYMNAGKYEKGLAAGAVGGAGLIAARKMRKRKNKND